MGVVQDAIDRLPFASIFFFSPHVIIFPPCEFDHISVFLGIFFLAVCLKKVGANETSVFQLFSSVDQLVTVVVKLCSTNKGDFKAIFLKGMSSSTKPLF